MEYRITNLEEKPVGTSGKGDMFVGKRVFITGASSGIGFGIAQRALERGAKEVWICSQNEERIASAAEKLSAYGKVVWRAVDTADKEAVTKFMDDFAAEGPVDYVFANAGISYVGRYENIPEERLRKVMDINFYGVFYTDQAALKYMIPQKSGYICNTGSIESVSSTPFHMPYVSSKFACLGMTESLRREVSDRNIRVSCILPGAVKSNIWGRGFDGHVNEEARDNNMPQNSLSEVEAADEIFAGMEEQRSLIIIHDNARYCWDSYIHKQEEYEAWVSGYGNVLRAQLEAAEAKFKESL